MYLGLGLLLSCSAVVLLINSAIVFAHGVAAWTLADSIVGLLDRILLILLIVEILYTVQVSFRERIMAAGPFLLIGLIAAIRRVLVLTAEFSGEHPKSDTALKWVVIELGVLTVLILALVFSTRLLSRAGAAARAERA